MHSSKPNNVKLLAAVIGGSAVVAMGALSMAFSQELGPNMVAKYSLTTKGTELSRQSPPRPAPRIAPS